MIDYLSKPTSLAQAVADLNSVRRTFRSRRPSPLVITASPRSGSTWLAEMLTSQRGLAMLWEPLAVGYVPEAGQAGFGTNRRKDPQEQWHAGREFLKQAISGGIINRWTARWITPERAEETRCLVTKFVRLNRFVPWVVQNVELEVPPVWLIRHPCAVVSSNIRLGWGSTSAEALAKTWCEDQRPIVDSGVAGVIPIFYEDLVVSPEQTIGRIVSTWSLQPSLDVSAILKSHETPSFTARAGAAHGVNEWRKHLDSEQVRRVMETVRAAGIRFYDADNDCPVERT